MSENDIKPIVGAILNIPEHLSPFWDITDMYPKDNPVLVLAHYNDKFNYYSREQSILKTIRGTIVDLETGAVVADSYGYTQSLPCYEELVFTKSPDHPNGVISIQTETSTYLHSEANSPNEAAKISIGQRDFDASRTKLFLGYEGALVRIFKWRGKVFFSTHRKIDASLSSWGGRDPFFQIYQELGGPNPESFFGEEEYSPYCYLFLIVDNRIRLATSTRDNRIIFLNVKKVWDEEQYAKMDIKESGEDRVQLGDQEGSTYFHETDKKTSKAAPYFYHQEFSLMLPTFGKEPNVFSRELNRAFIDEPNIDVETANKFLFPGKFAIDYPDTEEAKQYDLKENEILVDYSEDGSKINNIYFRKPTEPPGNEKLSGGDFVMLYTQTPDGRTEVYRLEPIAFEYRVQITGNDPNLYHRFVVEMVNFTKGTPQDLYDKYPRFIGADGNELMLDDPKSRQVFWWSLFYDAIAPAYKDDVDNFLEAYRKNINNVANFILNELDKLDKIADPEELKRVNSDTRRRFENIKKIALNSSRGYGQGPFGIVKNLLYHETGPSFYKMITTVNNIKKYRSAKETVPE